MPLPISGIAVSRPGRETWLLDEVLDTIIPYDPEARVERTRFKGVLLVRSSLDPASLALTVSRGYHSFMKRLVPALAVVEAGSWGDVEDLIRGLLEGAPRGPVRILVSIRGSGKAVAGRRAVEDLARSLGFTPSRSSRMVLAVESLDSLFVAAYGITRACGPDCIVVSPG